MNKRAENALRNMAAYQGSPRRSGLKHRSLSPLPLLGPLHMCPVDRAGSVSGISPRHSFLYKNFDVFI